MRVTRRPWGEAAGRPVWLFDIHGEGMTASVSNYGGVLQSLRVENDRGETLDVVLGYDSLQEYLTSDTFFGAMVGPIADRMDRGRCTLGGVEVRFPLNAGPDCMHCGDRGFHRMVWDWEQLPDGVRFSRTIEPEESGLPGTLEVELRCRVATRALHLEYAARCDREAAASFTNHSYFNLSGGRRDCRGDVLTVNADRYAETARMVDPICTGATRPVDGTPLDLRGGVRIGDAADRSDFREIAAAGGIDHYFPVPGEGLREMARITCPENGLALTCRSDAPGLLVYTGNGLEAERGKGGCVYGRNWGVCLETECFPNAVNLPEWRNQVLLRPGEQYRAHTEFAFRWA